MLQASPAPSMPAFRGTHAAALVALLVAATCLHGAAAVRAPAGTSARRSQQAWDPAAVLRGGVVSVVAHNTSAEVVQHDAHHTVRLLAKVAGSTQHRDLPDAVQLDDAAVRNEAGLDASASSQDAPALAADGAGATEDEASAAVQEAEAQAEELQAPDNAPPAAPSQGQATPATVERHDRQLSHMVERAVAADARQGAVADAQKAGQDMQKAGEEPSTASAGGGKPQDKKPVKAASEESSSDDKDEDAADDTEEEDDDEGGQKTGKDAAKAEEADGEAADKQAKTEEKDEEEEDAGEEDGGKEPTQKAEEGSGKPAQTNMSETSLDKEIERQLAEDKKLAPSEKATQADEESVPEDRLRKRKVGELEGSIARETGSKGLAEMLAGIKMDMFRVRDKVSDLENTIQAGVRLEALPADAHLVFPLSACMRYILMLTGLYFLIYTSAGVSKVFADVFSLGENTKTELSLRAACDTVFYAPMICVLFLGAHLRAMQISEGKGGPGEATELAMQVCTWSVIVQTMLVLLIPVLTGEVVRVDEETGLELPDIKDTILAGFLTLLRYAAVVGLYLSVAVICAQVVLMDTHSLGVRPLDLWDDATTAVTEFAPPVSAAMRCTMGLTGLFFAVHLCRSVLRSCLEFSGAGLHGASREGHRSGARELVAHWEQCLQVCAHAVSPAPMLCILFMAARMRALQLDAKSGRPQGWAEQCFYESSVAIAVHTVVIFLAKAFGVRTGASPRVGGEPGSSDSLVDEGMMLWAERLVFATRIISVLVVCWGFLGVVSSMMLIRAEGGSPAPPAPPAMMCAFAFAGQYFAVYVCVFLSQAFVSTSFSLGVASEGSLYLLQTVNVLQVAEYAVKLCPMLSVLFIGTWMRAQLLTQGRGSVQCWAQDAMYVAVVALFAQLVFALVVGAPGGDADPGPGAKQRLSSFAGTIELAKALSFVVLYGSVAVVGFSVLVIGPQTAVCEA